MNEMSAHSGGLMEYWKETCLQSPGKSMQRRVCCILRDFSCMMTAPGDAGPSEMWCVRKLILKHHFWSAACMVEPWKKKAGNTRACSNASKTPWQATGSTGEHFRGVSCWSVMDFLIVASTYFVLLLGQVGVELFQRLLQSLTDRGRWGVCSVSARAALHPQPCGWWAASELVLPSYTAERQGTWNQN